MSAPSISAHPSATPDPEFPAAAEIELLALLPEQDRERCQRADPGQRPIVALFRNPPEAPERVIASVEAGIECSLGGISAPDRLWLWQIFNTGYGNAEAALAAHGGVAGAVPGTCREERPAIERWSFGSLGGKLVCYESNTGDAVVLWIYDDSQLFAKALRDDGDIAALLDWWEEIGRFAAP